MTQAVRSALPVEVVKVPGAQSPWAVNKQLQSRQKAEKLRDRHDDRAYGAAVRSQVEEAHRVEKEFRAQQRSSGVQEWTSTLSNIDQTKRAQFEAKARDDTNKRQTEEL